MAITTAGDQTLAAAIDVVERRFSVSRCTAKLIGRGAPQDTGEVRAEGHLLVDALSACGDSVVS